MIRPFFRSESRPVPVPVPVPVLVLVLDDHDHDHGNQMKIPTVWTREIVRGSEIRHPHSFLDIDT